MTEIATTISNWSRNDAVINDTEEHNSIPVNPEYTNVYRAVIIKIPNEIL